MKKVAVGSRNPVKIQAVKTAFEKVWPDEKWEVVGIEVSSSVSNQPMSDKESIKGARNRAKRALKKIKADFGVGIEGGLHKIGKNWFDCGWLIVIDSSKKEGIGSTIRAHTPAKMMKHIFDGKELGEACDIIFNRKNVKQAEGQFGLLTNKHITRTSGYIDGVTIALARFIHPELYED
ncbi:MAG: hypothetical protein AUK12_05290 [Candidatus Levybacteria bacterium CG2_30_37_29]|nr:MAG: hypothetical protein AUK12_05290 [Candidatus Levybacteria bacterium CG2_30_37_29]